MKLSLPLICAAIICVAASCKKSDVPVDTLPKISPVEADAVNSKTNLDNAILLKLVNDTRSAGCTCGSTVMPPVLPLSWNHLLTAAAINQASYMATAKALTHASSNGGSVGDRVTATGYRWRAVGENIAVGQKNEQEVFNAWLKSEGHCKNIMNAAFKEMGAAKADSYWSQVFAAAL